MVTLPHPPRGELPQVLFGIPSGASWERCVRFAEANANEDNMRREASSLSHTCAHEHNRINHSNIIFWVDPPRASDRDPEV